MTRFRKPADSSNAPLAAGAVAECSLSVPTVSDDGAGPAIGADLLNVAANPSTLPSRWRIATLRHRLGALLVRIFGDAEGSTHEVCRVCEDACALVNPDIPTAEPCAGRPWVGQCSDCSGQVVTLTKRDETGGCPHSPRLHRVANKKPKPYLSLVKGDT